MTKRFKPKRKIVNFKFVKFLITSILVIYIFFKIIKVFVLGINFPAVKKVMLNYLLIDYDHYTDNIAAKMMSYASSNIINHPINILNSNLYYDFYVEENVDPNPDTDVYVSNPNEIVENNPLVYIYNSHQKESYQVNDADEHTEIPTVLLAAYTLQEKLNYVGINSIVEEQNITEFMAINNMKYYQSYDASRYYLNQILADYSTIRLYIDLHRDAATHSVTTTTINDQQYAKVMFVIGKENPNYTENLAVANAINSLILSKYPSLTRGIMEKEGAGVNGIYNQDLNGNVILIELGANENTFDEITNTIELIAPIIGEYLNDK